MESLKNMQMRIFEVYKSARQTSLGTTCSKSLHVAFAPPFFSISSGKMALSGYLLAAAVACFAALCSAQVVTGPGKILAPIRPISEIPVSFAFGYDVSDGLGMTQQRHETASNGVVEGTYGYSDPKGVYRKVIYRADENGFTSKLQSNEPGMANSNPAHSEFNVAPPPPAALAEGVRLLVPIQNTL